MVRGLILAACVILFGLPASAQGWQDSLDQRYLEALGLFEAGETTKAISRWSRLSAERHAQSAMALATLHEQGLAVRRNRSAALDWYNLAELLGHPGARAKIAELTGGMGPDALSRFGEVAQARGETFQREQRQAAPPRRVQPLVGYAGAETDPPAARLVTTIPRASNDFASTSLLQDGAGQIAEKPEPSSRPADGGAGLSVQPYLALSGGVFWLDEIEFDTANGQAELSSAMGWSGAVAFGAALGNWRGELELGYGNSNYDRLRAPGATPDEAVDTGLGGSLETVSGALNAYYDLPLTDKLVPWVGAGIGMINFNPDLSVSLPGGQTRSVGFATDLMLMGELGLGWRVNDRLVVGPAYRFNWINSDYPGTENFRQHGLRMVGRFVPPIGSAGQVSRALGGPWWRDLYVAASLGVGLAGDVRINDFAGGRVEMEPGIGYLATLAAGRRFGKLRVELETLYMRADQDRVFASLLGEGSDGDQVDFIAGGVNAFYDLWRFYGAEIYAGIGTGFTNIGIDNFALPDGTLVTPDNTTDPYLHGEIGFRYAIGDHFEIGPSWRYQWTDLDATDYENIGIHAFRLNTAWRF